MSAEKAETPTEEKAETPTKQKRKQRHPLGQKHEKAETTTLKDSTRLISTFSTKLILDLGALEILRQFAKMQLERLRTQGVLNADRPEPANLWDMKRLED